MRFLALDGFRARRASVSVLPLALGTLSAKDGDNFLAARFFPLGRDWVRDFNVALMPAWAITKAFFKSTKSFFLAMSHHAIAGSESHEPMVPDSELIMINHTIQCLIPPAD